MHNIFGDKRYKYSPPRAVLNKLLSSQKCIRATQKIIFRVLFLNICTVTLPDCFYKIYRVHIVKRERDHWEDLGVDGWIILRWISRRWDVGIWTGLGWPRIETGGGRL